MQSGTEKHIWEAQYQSPTTGGVIPGNSNGFTRREQRWGPRVKWSHHSKWQCLIKWHTRPNTSLDNIGHFSRIEFVVVSVITLSDLYIFFLPLFLPPSFKSMFGCNTISKCTLDEQKNKHRRRSLAPIFKCPWLTLSLYIWVILPKYDQCKSVLWALQRERFS